MSRARSQEEVGTVQAVSRALSILEALAGAGGPLSLTDLARLVGLKLTTVHRLLSTLMAHGFVEQEQTTSRYRLGLKAFEIGNAVLSTMDIRTIAKPFLKNLVDQLNETVNLAVLDRGEVVYIDQLESTKIVIVKMFARMGSRGPAHCTSSGKILLAGLPDDELQATLSRMPLPRFTAQTLTEPLQLLAEIRKIRIQGFAVDRGERDEGVCCVAAPIRNHEGRVVAALSVSVPTVRMEEETIVANYVPPIKESAASISLRLGYSGHGAAGGFAAGQNRGSGSC